jgi:hypothetical protein
MQIISQKGVSVLYAVFVVTVLLAISFGINGILISQVKMLGDIGHSVVAFYAADTGIEKVLIDRQNPDLTPGYYDGSLGNGATYTVSVIQGGNPGCDPGFYYCIKAIGVYESTKRAIEINY